MWETPTNQLEKNEYTNYETNTVNIIKDNPDIAKNVVDQKFPNPEKINDELKNNLVPDGGKSGEKTNETKTTTTPMPDYKESELMIEKRNAGVTKTWETRHELSEKNTYTDPLLDIKNLESGKSEIPVENRAAIINAINNLKQLATWEFEKLKIIWCTDASKIDTPNAIITNKKQFDDVRARYIAAGWSCPSYDELLQSPEDPQNTILWYSRAMEGILSLNLTKEQMKKIEIGNKLWTKENNGLERWFEIEKTYTEVMSRIIIDELYTEVYNMIGELDFERVWYYYNNTTNSYYYAMSQLDMKTHDQWKKEALFNRVMQWAAWRNIIGENIDPKLEEKMKWQIKEYLTHLIHVAWGNYDNGVWSAKTLTYKEYYTLAAVHDKLITEDEFKKITEEGDLSVLEDKQLESGITIKDFITEKSVVWVVNQTGWRRRYNVPQGHDLDKDPGARKISKNDYILMWLYFQMKSNQK